MDQCLADAGSFTLRVMGRKHCTALIFRRSILTPAHAKGGTGSIGLPMDVRVVARKRDPLGSDREDAHRNGGDAHMNGSTVASPEMGPLLHAPPFPAAGASNG